MHDNRRFLSCHIVNVRICKLDWSSGSLMEVGGWFIFFMIFFFFFRVVEMRSGIVSVHKEGKSDRSLRVPSMFGKLVPTCRAFQHHNLGASSRLGQSALAAHWERYEVLLPTDRPLP